MWLSARWSSAHRQLSGALPVGLHETNIPDVHVKNVPGNTQRLEPDVKQIGWKGRRLPLQRPRGGLKAPLEQMGSGAAFFPA